MTPNGLAFASRVGLHGVYTPLLHMLQMRSQRDSEANSN
jgi:hypothetical protein